jgi:glyoxylase-like metal-dependent hydrolase (beta-lactamase superfamily II)
MLGSGQLGMNASHELDCNVYLLDGGSEQAVIDCGTGYGVSAMVEEAARDGFTTEGIATICLTHAHMDHCGGAYLWKTASGARLAASVATAAIVEVADETRNGLAEARKSGIYPPDCQLTPSRVEIVLRHGDVLKVGDLTLKVMQTPGHSSDMISYYCPELRALFCGDTVFAGGQIAALNTPDFSMRELEQSIQEMIHLDVDILLPGHLCPILRSGHEAIERAATLFNTVGSPPSIV